MAGLRVRLFGPPNVEVDGAPLVVDTRKAVALLAYLAVTGRPHSRDGLADLLWPDSAPESARAALRRTLSVLGKGLGSRWLVASRGSVALDAEGIELDVERFRALLAEGRAAEAVELARGDFMEGFGLRDSPGFDDWQLAEVQALHRELAAVLERLARERADSGDLAAAIGYARRLLELDELQEPSHRLLIQLHARSGDRAAAISQYRECVRVLHRELGVAPLEETTALYEAVSEGRVVPGPAAPHGEEEPAPSLPFVGRERELAALIRAHQSDGRLVLVDGEPGIGKSRLVEELVERVRAAGAAAVLIRASESESGFAYGVVLEGLRAIEALPGAEQRLGSAPGPAVAEAARLVPELAALQPELPARLPIQEPGAQSRFVAGVADTLSAGLAGLSPGLLVVDDAHWADAASLEVLEYLARRLRGRPLCLLLTWRPDELAAEHPLRALVRDLRLSGDHTALTLGRLDSAAVEQLARAAGAAPFAERLYTETEGLPLFVVEYLAALQVSADRTLPVPVGVVELLRSRLARLGDAARQVLVAASVLGASFDPELVREVSGRSDEEVVAALEELSRRGLLAEGAGAYAFAHERLREVVDADTSLARRRLLHLRAAQALLARTRRDPALAGPIAEHFRLAGRDEEAAEFHRLAGERARTLFANAEAVAHLRAALALGHPDAPAIHEAIGDLLTLLGEYRQAVESYEAATALSGDAADIARLEQKLGSVHYRRGERELAAGHFAAAELGLADAGTLGRLAADRSLNEHRRGRGTQARSLARRALELATEAGDTAALAQAHNLLGILAASRGARRAARRELERSLALAGVLGDAGARVAALNNLALVARVEGQLERAMELTRSALELCAARGDRHREAALHNNLADLLHAAGREDEAMEELKRAVAIFAEIGADAGEAQPEIWKLVEW